MTIGDDDHWYGGGNAREHLDDGEPRHGDASRLPPFITRGPARCPRLPRARRAAEVRPGGRGRSHGRSRATRAPRAAGRDRARQDRLPQRVADPETLAEHATAGPDTSSARWLIENAIYRCESIYLEQLARDHVTSSCSWHCRSRSTARPDRCSTRWPSSGPGPRWTQSGVLARSWCSRSPSCSSRSCSWRQSKPRTLLARSSLLSNVLTCTCRARAVAATFARCR